MTDIDCADPDPTSLAIREAVQSAVDCNYIYVLKISDVYEDMFSVSIKKPSGKYFKKISSEVIVRDEL